MGDRRRKTYGTLLTCAYVAVAVYFGLMFLSEGDEICLMVALWAGAMLEIRDKHDITIIISRQEEKKQ